MVLLGLWIGIVGYGILYAGVIKLGGGTCSLGQAFRGQCQPAKSSSQAGQSGSTPQQGASAFQTLPTTGIPAGPSPGGGSW
jgi:hypothetical protein